MKDILQFFSNSADKNAGKGAGENVKDYDKYTKLNIIKDWRKMLSNNWVKNFIIFNETWKSVDEFFDYMKNKTDESVHNKIIKFALLAKFSQNEDLKKVLLLTRDSNFFLYNKKKSILQTDLMLVRKCIRNYHKIYDLTKITNFSYTLVSKILNIKIKNYKFEVGDKVIFNNKPAYIKGINYRGAKDISYELIFENGKSNDFVKGDRILPKVIFNGKNGYITSVNYNLVQNTYNIKLNDGSIFNNIPESNIIRDKIKLPEPSDEAILKSIKYRFPWMTDEELIIKLQEHKKL